MLEAIKGLEELAGELRTCSCWIAIGVGNRWREDDGVGCLIASELETCFPGRVFDAGERPEDLHEKIIEIRPEVVLILDAALFNEEPGSVKLRPLDESLNENILSSHRIPLCWLAEVWKVDAGSRIFFLGIQPSSKGYGEELSPAVRRTANILIYSLKGLLQT